MGVEKFEIQCWQYGWPGVDDHTDGINHDYEDQKGLSSKFVTKTDWRNDMWRVHNYWYFEALMQNIMTKIDQWQEENSRR